MPLQIRRGTTTQRLSITPLPGEPIYDIDLQTVFIGDGNTPGGVAAISGITAEDAQDAVGQMFLDGSHKNIIFRYDSLQDAANRIDVELDLSDYDGEISASSFRGSLFADDSGLIIDAVNKTVSASAIDGDLTGSVFGDNSSLLIDAVNNSINLDGTVKGDIIPDQNEDYDIGSNTNRFRDLYLSGNSLYLGSAQITSTNSSINLPAGSTVGGVTIGTGSGGNGGGSVTFEDFVFKIAADDSTQVLITNGNTVQFVGGLNIETSVDADGVVTISTDSTNLNADVITTGILTSEDSSQIVVQVPISMNTICTVEDDLNVLGDINLQGNINLQGSINAQENINSIEISSNFITSTNIIATNTISANTISGSIITGNVTGNVTGDLVGNVTGNLNGDVLGSLNGNVFGNLTGNVTGDLIGNVTGSLVGEMKGSLFGDDSSIIINGEDNSLTIRTINSPNDLSINSDGTMFMRSPVVSIQSSSVIIGSAANNVNGNLSIVREQYTNNIDCSLQITNSHDSDFIDPLFFKRTRGNPNLYSAVQNSDQLGRIDFIGYDGTQFVTSFSLRTSVTNTSSGIVQSGLFITAQNDIGTYDVPFRFFPSGRLNLGNAAAGDTSHGSVDIVSKIQYNTPNAIGQPIVIRQFFNGANANRLGATRARGTPDSPLPILQNDQIFNIQTMGYDGTGFRNSSAIRFVCSGPVSTSIIPGSIEFVTADLTGNMLRRVTIDENGILNSLFGIAGDITGSVFADDSTMIINGTEGGRLTSPSVSISEFLQLPSYADDAARSAAISTPVQGMVVFMQTGTSPAVTNKPVFFNGSAWEAF